MCPKNNDFRRGDRVQVFLCSIFIGLVVQSVATCQDISEQHLLGSSAAEIREFGGDLKMKFAWCPNGTFTIGSKGSDADRDNDEEQVEVTVKHGFWMLETEVTQRQWTSLMRSKPWSGVKGLPDISDIPATNVSYADAKRFCAKLTRWERRRGKISEGWAFCIPTEAQWEYACRAGSEAAYCFGDSPEELVKYAQFQQNNSEKLFRAKRVAQLSPNAWGLFDMHGNVAEWCADVYNHELLGGVDPLRQPKEKNGEEPKVQRGGHFDSSASQCRSAHRDFDGQDQCCELVGFRIVLCRSKFSASDFHTE